MVCGLMKENVAEVNGMNSFWYQINDYFEQHPYQEVFILAIVGSILVLQSNIL